LGGQAVSLLRCRQPGGYQGGVNPPGSRACPQVEKAAVPTDNGVMIAFHATRLAPSPTGALHLGHARTFLVTWWLARQAGARIFMRMEDLDLQRARPESVAQAYDDLRWLGIDWDPFEPAETTRFPVESEQCVEGNVVQSRRVGVYDEALDQLWQRSAIYPCTCSRADIAAAVLNAGNAPHESEVTPRYPGTCDRPDASLRGLTLQQATRAIRERTGKPVCWRLRVSNDAPVVFEDLIAGPQRFDVHQEVGDFPITRFSGIASEEKLPAAYQLACVVDDHAMGIDLVVRGDDLLSSTPRQLLLYRALSLTPPRFAHVPLVVGPDGKRLAKRHGESRIAQFRASGAAPEDVVGWAAFKCGLFPARTSLSAGAALGYFDLQRIPRERIVLDRPDALN
jgi:glutamyl-tRNA synthetase